MLELLRVPVHRAATAAPALLEGCAGISEDSPLLTNWVGPLDKLEEFSNYYNIKLEDAEAVDTLRILRLDTGLQFRHPYQRTDQHPDQTPGSLGLVLGVFAGPFPQLAVFVRDAPKLAVSRYYNKNPPGTPLAAYVQTTRPLF